jgi:hypothetical protein
MFSAMFDSIETRSSEPNSRFGLVSLALMVGAFIPGLLLEVRRDQFCSIHRVHNWAYWCLQIAGVIFWASWLVGLVGLKIDTRKWAALAASLLWLMLFVVLVLASGCF